MTHNNKKPKGPFTLLTIALIVSELLLGAWMLSAEAASYERIVAGSLSVAVLIAFLVVFCVVYWIKTEFDKWFCTPFPK
jgi:hypothetical protein